MDDISALEAVVRARVTEGLNLAAAAETTVAENASEAASDLSTGWTSPAATTNVTSVTMSTAGVITITYTPAAGGGTVTLSPFVDGTALTAGTLPSDAITWTCKVGTEPQKYVPSNCR